MFKSWRAPLYEARWGAVLEILKDMFPLLHVLAAGFDSEKFKRGGDFEVSHGDDSFSPPAHHDPT